MINKVLGKIESVRFGYSEYMFGLNLTLTGNSWGVIASYEYNPSHKDEPIELNSLKMLKQVQELLTAAKVDTVDKLKNKPVEATFEGNLLKDFRILTEVL